ncbi:MAG: hypothetical protein WC488_02740 [Candidatus Micrarchaeia archaeon]
MANRCKAFLSFDFLFSLIPILLIVSYTLYYASFLQSRAEENLEHQALFNKLVSASDYVVKIGAAKTEGNFFPEKKVYPNLIPSEDFSKLQGDLEKRLHFNSLYVSFEEGKGTCIYRLVVYEPTNEIRKLYFCGE